MRDPTDDRYPWTEGASLKAGRFLWHPVAIRSLGPKGLRVLLRCFHAFYRHDTSEWDVASGLNRAVPHQASELWDIEEEPPKRPSDPIMAWSSLPRGNQAFLFVNRDLAYDDILEIDEMGDDYCSLPTIYTEFRNGEPGYAESGHAYLEMSEWGGQITFDPQRRIRLFADDVRDPAWEERWRIGTGGALPVKPYRLVLPDGSIWAPP